MALRTGVNPPAWILSSAESINHGYVLNAECLKMTGNSKLKICGPLPENHYYVLNKFNNGFFHELLMRYETSKGENHWEGSDEYAVFLDAFAMDLGVQINEDDMEVLRSALKRVKIDREGKLSMEKALKDYQNNGERWDFRGIDLSSLQTPEPGRSVPVQETEREEDHLQDFVKNQNPYMMAKEMVAKVMKANKEKAKEEKSKEEK